MSSYNNIPRSTFVPNDEQAKLIAEYVTRYGPPPGFLPDGVENTDPEYKDLFHRMYESGFGPSIRGWLTVEEKMRMREQ